MACFEFRFASPKTSHYPPKNYLSTNTKINEYINDIINSLPEIQIISHRHFLPILSHEIFNE